MQWYFEHMDWERFLERWMMRKITILMILSVINMLQGDLGEMMRYWWISAVGTGLLFTYWWLKRPIKYKRYPRKRVSE